MHLPLILILYKILLPQACFLLLLLLPPLKVSLSSKPARFLSLHPSGSVPVLQHKDTVISDSVRAAEHASGHQLGEEDLRLVAWASKCLGHLYLLAGVGRGGGLEEEQARLARDGLVSSLVNLSMVLKERGGRFLGGEERHGLVDLVLWSMVERVELAGSRDKRCPFLLLILILLLN